MEAEEGVVVDVGGGGGGGGVAVDVAVDWLRRVEGVVLRFVLREPLVVEREQKRHTLGVGAAMTSRKDWLRPATDRRLSRGGMICRALVVGRGRCRQ